MKKWLIMLACLLAVLMMNGAQAAHPDVSNGHWKSGDWRYVRTSDVTAEIIGYTGSDAHVTIPARLAGFDVVGVWSETWLYFDSHDSLISVTIPDTVTALHGNPFAGCRNLRTIHVSPDHPTLALIDGVLFDKTTKELICYPCSNTASHYSIPSGIRSIADYALFYSRSLKSVSIPVSVTKIGVSAFEWSGLTSVSIPYGVTEIPEYAFYASDLLTAELPSSVTHIGERAFSSTNLASISIPESVYSIGDYAFQSCPLTSITLPNSVVSLGNNPFAFCSSLQTVRVASNHPVLEVINGALIDNAQMRLVFYPASSTARSYTIPQGIRVVGGHAFAMANRLEQIHIPDGVVMIERYAFYSCERLRQARIPDGLTAIDEYAFSQCASLASLTIPDSVTRIDAGAFEDCPNLTLTVGRYSYAKQYAVDNGVTYTYADANSWLYD